MADPEDRRTLAGVGPPPRALLVDSEATATGRRGARVISEAATAGAPETPRHVDAATSKSGVRAGDLLSDRYRIVRQIGAGGMGEVWEATHVVIGRAVAVKALVPDPRPDSTRAARMMREAQLVARIEHPHVVEIIDYGHTETGTPFIVMELLRGRALDRLLRDDGPIPWPRAALLGQQLARALAAAHDVGVIHRDLKPGNVFVQDDTGEGESCKLIDFGIAKAVELGADERALTRTGVVFGTPAYMSPEQARGEALDGRSDMFALGMILYEALTGERAFRAATAAEMLYLKLFTPPPLPSRRMPAHGIPQALDSIVRRCLFKSPEGRYANMRELADTLAAAQRGEPVAAPPEEAMPLAPIEVRARYDETVRRTEVAQIITPVQLAATMPAARGSGSRIAIGLAAVIVLAGALAGTWRWRAPQTSVPTMPELRLEPEAAPVQVAAPAPARPREPAVVSPAPVVVTPPVAAIAEKPEPRTKPPRNKPVRTESPPSVVPEPEPEPSEPKPSEPPKLPDADGIFR